VTWNEMEPGAGAASKHRDAPVFAGVSCANISAPFVTKRMRRDERALSLMVRYLAYRER
jgi:hypothetical protein